MKLLKWLPTKVVDRFLLIMAKMMIGDTEKYGLKRPKVGPLELKNTTGKTPVLDVGALSLIKDERIKVLECTENPHRRFLDFLILLIVFFFPPVDHSSITNARHRSHHTSFHVVHRLMKLAYSFDRNASSFHLVFDIAKIDSSRCVCGASAVKCCCSRICDF